MEKTTQNILKKIAILGAESTGKSTLCQALAKHYHTEFVPEYARTYFEKHDIANYSMEDLEYIANQQILLENEKIKTANHFLFCDTSLITIKIWAQHIFNKIPKYTTHIQASDYDLYLICNNDVIWIADEQRKDPNLREHIFKMNKHELTKINANYHIIKGLSNEKQKQAIELIDKLF